MTARFKFVNEVQRANSLVYNGLLSLLASRMVSYRDQEFRSPHYLCIMDANPLDVGSSEMPQAFRDRIDFSYDLPLISAAGTRRLCDLLGADGALAGGDLADLARPALTADEMEAVWADVARVTVAGEVTALATLVAGYLQRCRYVDRARLTTDFELPCRDCTYRGETCAKLAAIPGTRFTLSMLRLAQARAWLRGVWTIEVEDLLYGVPYTLTHRLQVRTESLRLYPNMTQWFRQELWEHGIRVKVPRWRQLVCALEAEDGPDDDLLQEFAARDLSASALVASTTGRAYGEVV